MSDTERATVTLLLSCADRPGLVAGVANWVHRQGGNIIHADQHTDAEEGVFFQRVEFHPAAAGTFDHDTMAGSVDELSAEFGMTARVAFADERPRLAVLVSRESHCLYDLFARWKTQELPAELVMVVSNHPHHADAAEHFGIPFHHLPVTPDNKPDQERRLHALLQDYQVDLVVLARYMQILSGDFVARYPNRIINIHHSFLPAFVGSRPYHQAHERGVKIIGVTAHYVTADLDQGPIIAQDVIHIDHRDGVADLVRKGRDLEKIVLARAVRAHVENRVLVYGNRTVVFA